MLAGAEGTRWFQGAAAKAAAWRASTGSGWANSSISWRVTLGRAEAISIPGYRTT